MEPLRTRKEYVDDSSPRTSISSKRSDGSGSSLISGSKELRISQESEELPSLLPHHGKRRSSMVGKLLHIALWLVTLALLLWACAAWLFGVNFRSCADFKTAVKYLASNGSAQSLVVADKLPAKPSPVVLTNVSLADNREAWTIAIPPHGKFPLHPHAYGQLCSDSIELVNEIAASRGEKGHAAHMSYYHVFQEFMDVGHAEQRKLLPGGVKSVAESVVPARTSNASVPESSLSGQAQVCNSSLTYVLETSDAGMGNTLMELWLAYGLAHKEGRAFFVDDRNWAYGSYATYFQLLPDPMCLPPPQHQRLPWPRHAQHLLISTATTRWAFGHAFEEEFEDPRGMEVMRQKNIFALLRKGYEDLFLLANDDAAYVERRVQQQEYKRKGALTVALHVRHGDKHPQEFRYRKDYIPLDRYLEAARDELIVAMNTTEKHQEAMHELNMVIASDDPDVYQATGLEAHRAQERIMLNDDATFDNDKTDWSGGFTRGAFWALGQPASTAVRARRGESDVFERDEPQKPSTRTMQLRALVGRAYILDLAVLGRADRVVCTVSSIGCRLLAVMLGWERGIIDKGWVNVDGDFDWKGVQW